MAEEPIAHYLDKLLEPAIEGKLSGETAARAFYSERLSDQTRARVGEEEFVIFWTLLARRHSGVLLTPNFWATVHAPLLSESQNQALVPVTANVSGFVLSDTVFGVPVHVLVGCSPLLTTTATPIGACSRTARSPTTDAAGNFNPVYRVIREGGIWKVVLHDGLVEEMKQNASLVTSRRYTPEAVAQEAGLTVRLMEIVLRRDLALVRLSVANANNEEVGLVNPLSLASLIDDSGATYGTRLLRSEIPPTVSARSTTGAIVAFEPVPLVSRRLVLVLPDIVVGSEARRLHLNIDLLRLPYASLKPEPVPGEPVLIHLLALLRQVFQTEEYLTTVYRVHLAQDTKAQVSETQFVGYHRAGAADAWLCRLDFPYDFSIGPPSYDGARQQAVIKVDTKRLETFNYRVVRESETWRVALTADMVRHINEWQPAISRRYLVSESNSTAALYVGVHSVELDASRTRLKVTISNRSRDQLPMDTIVSDATLTDRWGRRYSLVSRSPANRPVPPQSSVRVDIEFFGLSVEARRFVLNVTDPTLAPFLWMRPKIAVRVDLGCP